MPKKTPKFLIPAVIFSLTLLFLSSSEANFTPAQVATDAKKIIMMLDIVSKEYQIGVVGGKISNEIEYEESLVFLKQAYERYQQLQLQGSLAPSPLTQQFTDLIQKAQRQVDSAIVRSAIEKIKTTVLEDFGIKISETPAQPVSLDAGKIVYETNCKVCHGAAGQGDGPLAPQLNPKPAVLANPEITGDASTVAYDNFKIISVGIGGTPMMGWAETLSEAEIWNVTYYIRSFSNKNLQLPVINSVSATKKINAAHVEEVYTATRKLMVLSLDSFRQNKIKESAEQEFDAYLTFETLEAVLLGKNKTLGLRLESAFGRLQAEIKRNSPLVRVETLFADIHKDLDEAENILKEKLGFFGMFVQSLAIIVREGFEAILIIAALITFLIKSRNQDKLASVHKGVGAAIIASVATAYVLHSILKITATSQELLEGWIMLFAMVVLFWVSYWLITKIETRKWQQYITGKIREAVSKESQWTLVAVAFLSVYREGFETVLFYIGLYTSAGNSNEGIIPGFVAGCFVLALAYYLIKIVGMQIPVKWFFGVTSVFLYYMAFTFMGKGLHALQMGDVVSTTPAAFLPEFPKMGIYSSWETMIGQIILALAYLGALVYTFGVKPELQSKTLQRETNHIREDISVVHDLVEHISHHAKRCEIFLKDTKDQDLKELTDHLREIDEKVHELFDHMKYVENQLLDEYERLGQPLSPGAQKDPS
jgi:high-affinity iron transporter